MERARRSVDQGSDQSRARSGRAAGKRTRSERITTQAKIKRSVDAAEGSSGEPLPDDVRGGIEYLAGADVSGVRVHTGAASAEAATNLRADAYTTGQDIHFAAGKFAPDTAAGKTLLTHEIGHALQNRDVAPAPAAARGELAVSQPGDAREAEADDFAAAIAAGSPSAMPGIATAGDAPTIARWGEWCEDLFGGDEEGDEEENADDGGSCEDDWLGWLTGGDDSDEGSDGGTFTPRFAKPAALVVDYNEMLQVPIEILNVGELAPDAWFDVAFTRVDSSTGALLYQDAMVDPLGGLIDLRAFGVESDMAVHARVTIHHPDGSTTEHAVTAANVSVRSPAMGLVPRGELDNLVAGDTFTVDAFFDHVHDASGSPISVWPQLQSLGAGDAVALTSAQWDGDRMVLELTAREAGTSSLDVIASAPGFFGSDRLTLTVHEHATGGEECLGFTPWFAEPVELDVGFNDPIDAPVELLNADEWLASGVERSVAFGAAERDGEIIYDDGAQLSFEGVREGTEAALAFTADQEGTWRIHAAVTFTDPATGASSRHTPHVATVHVGSREARMAANQPEVDKQLARAAVLFQSKLAMQLTGLDSLRDGLLASSQTAMSNASIEKTTATIAGVLLKSLVTAVASGASPMLKAVLDRAITAAASVAGQAAVDAANSVRTAGMITAGDLREAQATGLIQGSEKAQLALIDERDGYYLSPDGVADATALTEALASVDVETIKRDVYLTALGGWTDALAAHDAPWSDEGELRIEVRFGGAGDTLEIVEGTIDALPPEVLAKLRAGPNTIRSLVDHGVHVEVFQTGDVHFEMSSANVLPSDYHTGSAAYYLVERANTQHGADIVITNPGAATAAAGDVWRNEILPLSLDKVLTE